MCACVWVGGILNSLPTWSINCSSWATAAPKMAECAKLVKGFKAGKLELVWRDGKSCTTKLVVESVAVASSVVVVRCGGGSICASFLIM